MIAGQRHMGPRQEEVLEAQLATAQPPPEAQEEIDDEKLVRAVQLLEQIRAHRWNKCSASCHLTRRLKCLKL